jgi:osmotically-inducible protein OsmY
MKNKMKAFGSCAALLLTATLGRSAMMADGKEMMSDSWITAKTKMSLASDQRVKGRQVSVETAQGLVILRGKVDSDEAKTAAEQTAKSIDNVKEVKNELQVVAPSGREAVEDKDEIVTARVKKSFSKDAALRKANIGVVTNAGVVSLTGEAPDLTTSALASWSAWKLKGVRSVKNDLTIKGS